MSPPWEHRGPVGNKGTRDSVIYEMPVQQFGEQGLFLELPKSSIPFDEMKKKLVNPYFTLLVGTLFDKSGDNAGRILISNPACTQELTDLFETDFTKKTMELFSEVEGIKLLLAMQHNDTFVVFYKIVNANDEKSKTIYLRAMKKINDLYLFDCAEISAPEILNVYGVLVERGVEKLSISK